MYTPTYRSDGVQPHLINIEFLKKTAVKVRLLRTLKRFICSSEHGADYINYSETVNSFIQRIDIFADFKQDESYTPSKISFRAGTNFHDLQVSYQHKNKQLKQ